MELTMRFLRAYPERELLLIGQMVDNVKNQNADMGDRAEDIHTDRYSLAVDDIQRASVAEDVYVYDEFLAEANQLSIQMAVVALHLLVERTLKKIIRQDYHNDNSRIAFKKIKDIFTHNGIDLQDFEGFDGFDEVRLVSNAIKHGGAISEEISLLRNPLYPCPIQGQAIRISSSTLDLYDCHIKSFLRDICSRSQPRRGAPPC